MKKMIALAAMTSLLAACVPAEQEVGSARTQEQAAVSRNQAAQLAATPLPVLSNSLERQNIVKRIRRINAQNMSGCIYLISQGTVMAFYPVKGKVSSLKSYLTPGDKIVDDPNGSYDAGSVLVEAPDLDGAYGENAEGVFFFTADTDSYVEWAGDYVFTDSCLTINQQPRLERQVTSR